jgi:hypothetical protein
MQLRSEQLKRCRLTQAAASGLAIFALSLTLQAQLPTMSDVDHGTNATTTGPLPE